MRSERDERVRSHPLIKAALEIFPEIDPDRDIRVKEFDLGLAGDESALPPEEPEDDPDF